eukprot:12067132-Ditylum_brightwellii.AAC.1
MNWRGSVGNAGGLGGMTQFYPASCKYLDGLMMRRKWPWSPPPYNVSMEAAFYMKIFFTS